MDLEDRLVGTLLGCALGDALGLAAEGMTSRQVARRFGKLDRFRIVGRVGFVSDDTEQSALVAQSILREGYSPEACARAFRKSLLGWFLRLPFGVGLATVKACFRIMFRRNPTGVDSAGNGSAMRAAVIGVYFRDDPENRVRFARALAETTHLDIRAVEGSLYVSELAAACANRPVGGDRISAQNDARMIVSDKQLGEALDLAVDLFQRRVESSEAAKTLGNSGFVVHTLAFATYGFLNFGADPFDALKEITSEGGDADSIGAILGSWLGALHGESALPGFLVNRVQDGPFGPTHLRALASNLALRRKGEPIVIPRYSIIAAFIRNLFLTAVAILHVFRRALPF